MSALEKKTRKIEAKRATKIAPYHYVGAGLPNVWLVGVEYRLDRETGEQSADIPCLPALLDALAEALLYKQSALTGDELRFLRKRLGKASKDFATLVGLTSEQYSRVENGASLTQSNDKLARLLYAGLKKLSSDSTEKVAQTTWSAEINQEQRIVAKQNEEHQWVVQTKAAYTADTHN